MPIPLEIFAGGMHFLDPLFMQVAFKGRLYKHVIEPHHSALLKTSPMSLDSLPSSMWLERNAVTQITT